MVCILHIISHAISLKYAVYVFSQIFRCMHTAFYFTFYFVKTVCSESQQRQLVCILHAVIHTTLKIACGVSCIFRVIQMVCILHIVSRAILLKYSVYHVHSHIFRYMYTAYYFTYNFLKRVHSIYLCILEVMHTAYSFTYYFIKIIHSVSYINIQIECINTVLHTVLLK